MIYAQFFHQALNSNGIGWSDRLIEACGDRSVIILDGRNRQTTWHRIAEDECKKESLLRINFSGEKVFPSLGQSAQSTWNQMSGDDRYETVIEDHFAEYYPQERPHYE